MTKNKEEIKVVFYDRRVIRVGASSMGVILPKDVMLKKGIDVGDTVDVEVTIRK